MIATRASHISPFQAMDIMEKTGMGVTPGSDFGRKGEGYLRFSCTNSVENMAEALVRIERYLGTLERR
jgi:aspartate/methionine/tyrosine aminotransferase